MEEAAEFIPAWVTAIAAYWRGRGPKQISIALMHGPPLQPYRASCQRWPGTPIIYRVCE